MLKFLSCSILAGGKSRRFGSYKAITIFRDKPLIYHVLKVVQPLASEIIICVSNRNQYKIISNIIGKNNNISLVIDKKINIKGVLSGFYTSLVTSKMKYILIVACDMPFICDKGIKLMYREISKKKLYAVVPIWPNKYIEPLFSIYNRVETLKILKEIIKNRKSNKELHLRKVIENLKKVEYMPVKKFFNIGCPKNMFYNINYSYQINF
ncbi:MAG: molybdenum cofactor guanylyltransferase [Nitrososphaerota archaeon]